MVPKGGYLQTYRGLIYIVLLSKILSTRFAIHNFSGISFDPEDGRDSYLFSDSDDINQMELEDNHKKLDLNAKVWKFRIRDCLDPDPASDLTY